MQVDIYIREKSGKREIRIPLLPEEIVFQSGDATAISYDIMGLGEVAIPSGTELGKWGWKSEFPGFNRQDDPMIRGHWFEANDYDRTLNDWKEKGTELNLLVTGYPINADVYIKKYHGTASGAFGDISYEIEFFEARSIVVTTTKAETQTATTTRPASTSSTYTIKSGDTLWAISQKYYGTGTKWKTIYDANKDIIEKTAKKHGKKSSDNGHWIYPGVTLTIPGVGGKSSGGSSASSSTSTKTSNTTQNTTQSNKVTTAYLADRNQTVTDWVNDLYGNWKVGSTK